MINNKKRRSLHSNANCPINYKLEQDQQNKSAGDQLKEYYETKFLKTIKFFKIPEWLGWILLLIRFLQQLSLIISEKTAVVMAKDNNNFQQIKYFVLFKEYDFALYISLIFLGINGWLVTIWTMSVWFHIFKLGRVKLLILQQSFIVKIYPYCLFIPSLYFSISQISKFPIIAINLALTLLIRKFDIFQFELFNIIPQEFVLIIHDSDYEIVSEDSLACNNKHIFKIAQFLVQIFQIGAYSLKNDMRLSSMLSVFLGILKIFNFNCYRRQNIVKIELILSLLLICLSGMMAFVDINTSITSIQLFILLILPFSYQFSSIISKKYYNIHRLLPKILDSSSSDTKQIDLLMRIMHSQMKFEFEKYKNQDISILLERISVDHITNCTAYPTCFCNIEEEEKEDSGKLNLMSGKLRKSFLLDFMFQKYHKGVEQMIKSNRSRDLNLILSYLSFLIEVQESKLLFFVETIRLSNWIQMTSIEKCFVHQIQSKGKYLMQEQLISSSRMMQTDIDSLDTKNQKIENMKNKFIQQTDLKESIYFDEKLIHAEEMFYKILENKLSLLVSLSSDYINLLYLQTEANEYFIRRNQFYQNLNSLSILNNKSHRLIALQEAYCSHLGFAAVKKYQFDNALEVEKNQKKNKKIHGNKQPAAGVKIENIINLFSRSGCVVFLSLVGNQGAIKKVSNSFDALFGFHARDAFNKDISFVMSKMIGQHHHKMVSDYYHKPNVYSHSIVKSSFSSLVGRNKKGWAVPISVNFKPDIIGYQDCGLVAYIEKIKTCNNFIMTGIQEMKIEIVTKEIYQKLFSNLCNKIDLTRIYMINIIPMLKYLEQCEEQKVKNHSYANYNFFDTVAILPKEFCNKSMKKNYDFYKQSYFNEMLQNLNEIEIDQNQLFKISLKLSIIRNRYIHYNLLEIQSISQVKTISNIKQSLQLLQNQLNNNMKTNISFEKAIKHMIFQRSQENPFMNFNEISQFQGLDYQQYKERENDQQLPHKQDNQNGDKNTFNYTKSVEWQKVIEESKDKEDKPCILTYQSPINSEELPQKSPNTLTEINFYSLSRPFYQEQEQSQRINRSEDFSNTTNDASMIVASKTLIGLGSKRKLDQIGDEYQLTAIDVVSPQSQQIQSSNLYKNLTTDENSPFFNNNLKKKDGNQPNFKKSTKNLQFNNQITNLEEQLKYSSTNNQQINEKEADKKQQDSQFQRMSCLKSQKFFNAGESEYSKSMKNQKDVINSSADEASFSQNSNKEKNNMKQNYQKKVKVNNNNIFRAENEIDQDEEADEEDDNQDQLNEGSRLSDEIQRGKKQKRDLDSRTLNPLTCGNSSSKYVSTLTLSYRNNLRRSLLKQKSNNLLYMLKLFGILSVSCMFIITFFVYFEMVGQIDIAKVTFNYIPWPLMFRCAYSLSSSYQALLQISNRHIFNNSRLDQQYMDLTKQRANFGANQLSQLYLHYVHGQRDKLGFFQSLTSVIVPMVFNKDLNVIPQNQRLKSIKADKKTLNVTLAYFLQTQIGYIYRFSTVKDNLYEQVVRLDNVAQLINNVTSLDKSISDQCDSILNKLEKQGLALMIIDVLIIFILILSIFPLYIYVQKSNQKVLSLFATIKQDHLDQMIKLINDVLILASQQQKVHLGQLYQQSITHKKKMSNSSTSSLPLFHKGISFFAFLAFGCLIIQPIMNYASITSFSSEVDSNILLIKIQQIFIFSIFFIHQQFFLQCTGTVYDLRAQMISSSSQNYQYLLAMLDSTYSLYNWSYYQSRIPNLVVQNQQKLINMTNIVRKSQLMNNRYSQTSFNQFFYKILEGNMCEALDNFPQYATSENVIDSFNCISSQNGELKKGLILSFSHMLQRYEQLNTALFLVDSNKKKEQIKFWESSTDLRDFDDFFTIISQALNCMKDFVITTMKDQLMDNATLQTYLFIYQCFCLGIIFKFGWIKFQSKSQQEMFDIRKLISIIDVDVVLENPYLLNFITH